VREHLQTSNWALGWKLNGIVAVIAGPLLGAVIFLVARTGPPTALQAVAIALVCSACVGVGMHTVHRMARRIRRLAETAEEIREGVRAESLPVDGRDEIGRLATVLNEVITRVQRANADLVKLVGEHMESLELQNSILDNAAEYAILSDDASGRILTANRGAVEIFGLENEDDILGSRLVDFVREEGFDDQRLREILSTTDSGATWHGALDCRRQDGSIFPARCRVAPRRDRAGNAAGRVILLRDMTREREAERRYGELFHSLQEAVYVTCRDGRFLDANEAMARLMGVDSVEALLRSDARDLYRDGAERDVWLEQVDRDGFVRDHEVRLRNRKGEEHFCIESTRALRGPDGVTHAYLGTLVNITERRHLQQQVARSQKLDAVGTLASGLAHDFNNILAAIVPNAELIERHRQAPEPVRERARTIRAAAERAGGITRQLLRFARQDREVKSTADLNALVAEASRLLEPSFADAVRFELALDENAPVVTGETTSLEQVVVNLVLNARDACGSKGSVVLSTGHRVVRRAAGGLRPGHYGVITVEDDGEGMSRAQLERIFDPFFTTKGSGVGTGLGLSVVYATVTGYRGHIHVDSEPGRGTRFDVFLPLAPEAAVVAKTR
jgi:PAS domain S-box-containing protein